MYCDIRTPDCQHSVFERIEKLRGIAGSRPKVKMVTEDAFHERVYGDEEGEEARTEAFDHLRRGLTLFNLAPADYSVERSRRDRVSRVSAAYFGKTKEVLIVDRGEPMDDGRAMATLTHEYVHALQDEALDAEAYEDRWIRDFDSELAIRALREGEATHFELMTYWKLEGIDLDRVDWGSYYQDWIETEDLLFDEDPMPINTAYSRFTYAYGGRYIQRVLHEFGREGLEQMYENPPLTTREIMQADPYRAESYRAQLEAMRTGIRSEGVPELEGAPERVYLTSLGEFLFGTYSRRKPALFSKIEADVFSVHLYPETDRIAASWRVRLEPSLNAAPNLMRTWIEVEAGYIDPDRVTWRSVDEPDAGWDM